MKVVLSHTHTHIHKAKNLVQCHVTAWAEPTHMDKLLLTNFDMENFHAILMHRVTVAIRTVSSQKQTAPFFSKCGSFARVLVTAIELRDF